MCLHQAAPLAIKEMITYFCKTEYYQKRKNYRTSNGNLFSTGMNSQITRVLGKSKPLANAKLPDTIKTKLTDRSLRDLENVTFTQKLRRHDFR
jgi:hypothetical protein